MYDCSNTYNLNIALLPYVFFVGDPNRWVLHEEKGNRQCTVLTDHVTIGGTKMDEVTKATFERLNDENVRQNHRIESLEEQIKEIRSIAVSVERLSINMDNMLKEMKKQGDKIDKIESEPGDALKSAKTVVVNSIIAAIVGALMASVIAML